MRQRLPPVETMPVLQMLAGCTFQIEQETEVLRSTVGKPIEIQMD